MSAGNKRLILAGACLALALCSLSVAADSYAEKDTPMLKAAASYAHMRGATVNILYCYSCGYKKVFQDYATIIVQKYPGMNIYGANYDPPGFNMYMSRFIGIAKMLLIASILGGLNIFGRIGQWAVHPWWEWCITNKLYSCMMLFFLCNMIEGQLVSSGAFEISLNNMPVWSKLETGRIPQPPELFQIIDNTLRFYSEDPVQANFVK